MITGNRHIQKWNRRLEDDSSPLIENINSEKHVVSYGLNKRYELNIINLIYNFKCLNIFSGMILIMNMI